MTDSELEEYRWKLDRQRISVLEKENDELKSRSKILEQQLADLRQLVKELPFGRKP
jgi:cell division protein FtsB